MKRLLRDGAAKMRFTKSAIVLLAAFATVTSAAPTTDYQVIQSVTVAGGSAKILEDARLTPALARLMWGNAVDPIFVLGEDNPAARPFKARPLMPARLRETTTTGKMLIDVILNSEAPLARIEMRRLAGALDPIYLVTTDDNAGWGSYSGRATSLYAVRDGRLTQLQALGASGKTEPVVLVNTLKSGWKVRDTRAAHTVIEQLYRRADLHGDGFVMTFITYWFDRHSWRVAQRTARGFWEGDESWPATTMFPRARG